MIITKEIDYALRILRALSDGHRKPVTQLKDEALVPEAFAYKITKKLAIQEWIIIYRGVDGGCEANKPLSEITLLDVIKIVGDHKPFAPCTTANYECKWKEYNSGMCNVHCNLVQVQQRLENELKKTTLDELFFC